MVSKEEIEHVAKLMRIEVDDHIVHIDRVQKMIAYFDILDKANVESSAETMKLFGENWQKSLNDVGMNSFKEFTENWQKALNDTNASTFKQFAENWQKSLSSSGLEQMNVYGEMMKKFAETWSSMWPKSQ